MLGMRIKQFQWVVLVVHVLHGPAEKLVRPNLNRSQDKVNSPSPFHLGGKGDPLHHLAVSRSLGTDYVCSWRQESPVVTIGSFGKANSQEDSLVGLSFCIDAYSRIHASKDNTNI